MKTERELAQLNQQILSGLGIPADHATWLAFNAALDYEIENVTAIALAPDLSNESRQFNAGGAARLIDFRDFLRKKFAEAHGE